MADYQTIMAALRNADAAGDTAAATRLAQMAREAKAAEAAQANPEGQGFLNNAAQQVGDGMFFGLGDEISARLNAMTGYDANTGSYGNWGTTYEDQLAAVRGQDKKFESDHPIISTGAEIAGGAIPLLLPAGAVMKGGTLGHKAIAGAKLGAVSGAAYGFGDGEGGFGNRAASSLKSGIAGAGLGAAFPLAAAGVGRVTRSARSAALARRQGAELAAGLGVSRKAATLFSDVLGMDDPARMRAALSRYENDAMLADAGPSAQGALDAVIQSPGDGARIALRRIDARAEKAGGKLKELLDKALGKPASAASAPFAGLRGAKAEIRDKTAAARSDAYSKAYAAPIDYGTGAMDNALPDLRTRTPKRAIGYRARAGGSALLDLQTRIPKRAIDEANALMRMRGEKSKQIMAKLDEDGNVIGFEVLPDVRQWDYIKRGLDQMAEVEKGKGALGGQTPKGATLESLSRDVRDNLAYAVPDYRTALDTAQDAIQRVKGVDFGAKVLNPSTTREMVAQMVKGATKPEIAAIKEGLRHQIDDTLANVRAVATDPNVNARQAMKAVNDLSSDSSRAKMSLILGNEWKGVEKSLEQARNALGLRARVATNSRTFGRQQFGQMLDESIEPGVVGSGDWIGLTQPVKKGWQFAAGTTPGKVSKSKAEVKAQLADLLTRSGARKSLDMVEKARLRYELPGNAGKNAELRANLLGVIYAGQSAPTLQARLTERPPRKPAR